MLKWMTGALLVAVTGCGLFGTNGGGMLVSAIPTTAPDISGTITQVTAPGTIRIEENPNEQSGSNKAVVRFDEPLSGKLFKRTSGSVEALSFSEIKVGQRARAWFDGPVAESYPLQARAKVVVIE